MTRIAIIGAGLSGLTAAQFLKDFADITIFDKSRGTGGRMATRRAAPYSFDHGTQFFTAKSEAFQSFINPLINAGVIVRWDARFAQIEINKITSQSIWSGEHPHYVGTPSMNTIGKYLSRELNIKLNTRIAKIKKTSEWQLWDDKNKSQGSYDWVITTTPASQALELVPEWVCFHPKIKEVKMKACFSLMLGFNEALPLKFDAAHIIGRDISWITVNSSKPRRPDNFSLLIHSTNDWADAHIDDNRKFIEKHLCDETSEAIGHNMLKAAHRAIHGWRFANIDKSNDETCHVDPDAQIAACGDWCIQGRIEAAFRSGHELATCLLQKMDPMGGINA